MKARPSIRGALLGIVILWHLFFLLSSNLIGFLQDNRTHMAAEHFMDQVAQVDTMWSQLTGQNQKWTLFAPMIARDYVFPAIELRWENESKLVVSENEPADLDQYFRVGGYRLRRYERNLTLTLGKRDAETPTQAGERWREEIRAFVTENADILDGYLRWCVQRAMRQWPDRPWPGNVVLIMRRYHIREYAEAPPHWTGPHSTPVARWKSVSGGVNGVLEWHDPASGNYQSVRP